MSTKVDTNNASAADFLFFPRRVEEVVKVFALPKENEYVVLNEIRPTTSKYYPAYGDVRKKTFCGIGKIVKYYTNYVMVKIYRSPYFCETVNFQTSDFKYGHLRYKYLHDYLYMSEFSCSDMKFDTLHPKLQSLLK